MKEEVFCKDCKWLNINMPFGVIVESKELVDLNMEPPNAKCEHPINAKNIVKSTWFSKNRQRTYNFKPDIRNKNNDCDLFENKQ